MQNKNTWINFSMGLGAYLLLILLARHNIELFSYTPGLLVLGTLTMYMVMGFVQKDKNNWGGRIAVLFPYIAGSTMYMLARVLKSEDLMGSFKKIVPQIYQPLNKISLLIDQKISKDVLVIILIIIFVVIGTGALEVGGRMASSEGSASKFFYNIILVWSMHFYLVLATYALVAMNPAFINDERMKNLFAIGMTLVIFFLYFLVGRACRSIDLPIIQFLSCTSVSLSAIIMYILGMLLIWDIGLYERYILPVATSFIGAMCKALGYAKGSNVKVISQYGITSSLVMIIAPSVLIFVGKLASISEEVTKVDMQLEDKFETEIE